MNILSLQPFINHHIKIALPRKQERLNKQRPFRPDRARQDAYQTSTAFPADFKNSVNRIDIKDIKDHIQEIFNNIIKVALKST